MLRDTRVMALVLVLSAAMLWASVTYNFAADAPLLELHNVIVDRSLQTEQAGAQIIAARRYDSFWNTGDEALARVALASNFIDNTLPPFPGTC
jgi:hypothetical protein